MRVYRSNWTDAYTLERAYYIPTRHWNICEMCSADIIINLTLSVSDSVNSDKVLNIEHIIDNIFTIAKWFLYKESFCDVYIIFNYSCSLLSTDGHFIHINIIILVTANIGATYGGRRKTSGFVLVHIRCTLYTFNWIQVYWPLQDLHITFRYLQTFVCVRLNIHFDILRNNIIFVIMFSFIVHYVLIILLMFFFYFSKKKKKILFWITVTMFHECDKQQD